MSVALLTQVTLLVVVSPLLYRSVTKSGVFKGAHSSKTFFYAAIFLAGVGLLFGVASGGYFLLGGAVAAGLFVGLFDPVSATCFLIANLILRPWELLEPNGFLLMMPKALAGIALLSFLIGVAQGRCQLFRWNAVLALFLSLSAWLILSTFFSHRPEESFSYLTERIIPIAVTLFLVSTTFDHQSDLRLLKTVMLSAIGGVVTVALLQSAGIDRVSSSERLEGLGMWGNANDLGALIVFTLPFVLLPASSGPIEFLSKYRLVRWSYLAVLLVGLWYTQSRGAMLALAVGTVVYLLCCTGVATRKLMTFCVAVAIPIVFLFSLNRDSEELDMSKAARWNYVVAGTRMAAQHPLFGVGVSNYPRLYEAYTPAFDEWGQRTAHSSWVLVLAEGGVVALMLFLAFIGWAFRAAWGMRRSEPSLLVAVVSYGVAMSFLSHSYNLLPYLLVVLVLVTARTSPINAAKSFSETSKT